jgi:rRNA methylases
MYIDTLSSARNPKIKELLLLMERSKQRREQGLFVIEGVREISAAVKAGYEIESTFFLPQSAGEELALKVSAKHIFSLTQPLYAKIAYREGTEGIIAIAKYKEKRLADIRLSENPLIIVLESVEKPGNLGAVIRTADGVDADAVIICDPLTDIFNPNIIRSSLGGVFACNICACNSEDAYEWLTRNNIRIFTTELQASKWYHDSDLSGATAVVMGSESSGLKSFWKERAAERIKIPMRGEIDSLNVSVSTAVICYEALRQRSVRNV